MQIGFEAKRIFSNFTGLGNYGRFVVSALAQNYPTAHLYLFTPKVSPHPEVDSIISRGNVEVVEPHGVFKGARSLWRSWGMSFSPAVKKIDIFHGLSQELPAGLPKRIKKVVTVHDLIFIRYPQFYHVWDVSIYKAKVIRACREADAVIAISEQTKQDLIYLLQVDPKKIHVIYQGCHPNFLQPFNPIAERATRDKYALPSRYILNVGTVEKRKNVGVLIRALAQLDPALRIPLVIVGRHTEYADELKQEVTRLQLNDFVIWLTNASFLDFPAIYRGAMIFVYPSVFEGFGIPLVEAIASRVPVVTSIGSCFSEAAGPSSVYIDPQDATTLASALTTLIQNPARRKEMVDDATGFIRKFDASVIGAELNKLYTSF